MGRDGRISAMLLFVVFGLAAVVLVFGTVLWVRNPRRGLGSGDYPYYANPGTLEEAERAKLATERTSARSSDRGEASLRVNTELTEAHRPFTRPQTHSPSNSLSQ
jgi:hypothetical protein